MNRRIDRVRWVFGWSLAAMALLPAAGSRGQAPAPGPAERLGVRDRLAAEASRLEKDGKVPEALAALEQALAIEREVLGSAHEDVAGSLAKMAEMHEEMGAFAAAVRCRKEILEIRKQVHGEGHWRATDARLDLEDLERLGRMTDADRGAAQEARKLGDRVHKLWKAGRPQEALPLAEEAVAIRRRVWGPEHRDLALALFNLGAQLQGLQRFEESEAAYQEALGIRRKVLGKAHPDCARSLKNLAILKGQMQDLVKAEDFYQQVLAIRREALGEEAPDYAVSLMDLGSFYAEDAGQPARAEDYYLQAVGAWKKIRGEDSLEHGQALSRLGLVCQKAGRLDEAERHLEKASEALRKAPGGQGLELGDTLNNLALLRHARGDFAGTEAFLKESLRIAKENPGEKSQSYAATLGNLAWLYQERGDYARAEPLLQKVLAIEKEVLGENDQDHGFSLDQLGQLYQLMHDPARAEPLHQKALQIIDKALGPGHPARAQVLNNLAGALADLGDFRRAEPLYLEAIQITKNAYGEDHPDYTSALGNLAVAYNDRKDFAKAEPLQRQVLETNLRVMDEGHPDLARDLGNLGTTYVELGDLARAALLLEKAVEVARGGLGEHHPSHAEHLKQLGSLRWAQGEHAAALSLLTRALDVFRENLDLAAAVQSERQQLRMAEQYRDTLDRCIAAGSLAATPADASWAQVLAWKGTVFARQRRLRALQGRPDLVPLHAELTAVCGRLAAASLEVPDPKGREERSRRLEALTGEKEAIERKLAGLSAEIHRERALAQASPVDVQRVLPEGAVLVDFLEYTHLRVNPAAAVAATRDEPPEKRTYLFEKERRLVAFAVRRQGPVARIDLGAAKPIEEAVEAWRRSIEGDGGTGRGGGDVAGDLRRRVLDPLASHLGGAKVFLVSPDGALARLPLAALPGREPQTYLLEDMAMAQVPFPQALPDLLRPAGEPAREPGKPAGTTGESDKAAPPAPPGLLVVGDVDYESEPGKPLLAMAGSKPAARGGSFRSFEPLRFTASEADSVRSAFLRAYPGAEVRDLRGASATEAAFAESAPRRRYLHVATHGFFAPPELRSALSPEAPEDPGAARAGASPRRSDAGRWDPGLLSGIVLAGANRKDGGGADGGDGILTALELAPLDLEGTEILVLSACETGLGASAGGEGLLGLQRAAQIAGARSVVASLWKVDDEDARRFMGLFYENLWRKGLPKIEALRQAQLAVLRQGAAAAGAARGPGKEKPAAVARAGLASPRAWAAWTLSGDWR